MAEITSLIRSVRELAVYKHAYALSIEVHKASLLFPKIEQYALADQMRRCSKSICANLAEGFAKQPHSKAEFRRFLSMAIGSCSEMETWLYYAFDLEYISRDTMNRWLNEYASVFSMLIKLRSKLQ